MTSDIVAARARSYDGQQINAADNFRPSPGVVSGGTSRGTSADYLTRRIVRDYPDIAERMRNGEFTSVRAAALEAGITARMLSVRVDDPASIARVLRKHMTLENFAELITLLREDDA
jgi:hypothetical protein